MIKFLLWLHNLSYGANEKNHYKRNAKIKWVVCVCTYISIRFLFYFYMKIRGFLRIPPKVKGIVNENVVVSMTSFPARIKNVWMVVDSICRQDMRPFSIELYLSIDEFSNKEKDLPDNLIMYEKYGLKIIWVSKNLKPHKKYFFVFQRHPDKSVITVDDDVFYRHDLVSRLWNMHQTRKKSVCANRVTPILDKELKLNNYNLWGKNQEVKPEASFNYLAIGTCGVLYPPSVLRNSEVFDTDGISRNCIMADDLWLKCHEVLNKISVTTAGFYCQSIEIAGSQVISLRASNCNEDEKNGNDLQWENLDKEYNLNKKLIELVKDELNS